MKHLLIGTKKKLHKKILKDSKISKCTREYLEDFKINHIVNESLYPSRSNACSSEYIREVMINLKSKCPGDHNRQFICDMMKSFDYTFERTGIRKSTKEKKDKKVLPSNVILPSLLYNNLCDNYVRQIYPDKYTSLPSQAVQQITQNDVSEAMKSYLASRATNRNSRPPNYMMKSGFHCVTWKKHGSIKVNSSSIELSLGRNAFDIIKSSMERFKPGGKYHASFDAKTKTFDVHGKHKHFVSKHNNSLACNKLVFKYRKKKTKWFRNVLKNVKQIKLVPIDRNGDNFKLCITYIKTIKCSEKLHVERFMGIDLGLVNLATMATNVSSLRPWIISGRNVLDINKKYLHLISTATSEYEEIYQKNKITHYIRNLWDRRHKKLNDMFQKLASRVIEYAHLHKIHKVIVGYNKNWKQNCSLGRKINKDFCSIPFRNFVNALFCKAETYGIELVENEEAYTSKCDALAFEDFDECKERCKLKSQSKRRVKRGLYQSVFNMSTYINADVNAAINIVRKHVLKSHKYCYDNLRLHVQKYFKHFLNPIKVQANVLLNVRITKNARTMTANLNVVQSLCQGS